MSDSTQENQPEPEDTLPETASATGKEISIIYLAALALILGCVFVATAVPIVSQNLYALVAAVFVGLPYWWLSRRGADFERFGLTWERAGRGALWGLAFTLLTLGPFAVGYWWWQTQVQEQSYEFGLDNFYQWPVEYEGRPTQWGEEPGVFVWSDGLELHVGVRTGDEPVEVAIGADCAFRPGLIGGARLLGPAAPQESDAWKVRVPAGNRRSQLIVDRGGEDGPPREIELTVSAPSGEPVAVYRGQSKTPVDSDIRIDRGLWWMVLWVLTQIVFIALPEEFFYRGYLQTRIRDALEARRHKGTPDVAGDEAQKDDQQDAQQTHGRRVLGVSAPNLITSALFALGHLLIPIGGVLLVSRLSVFFPSLVFGWLRERTGTIAAPVIYHAGANLLVLFAAPHFF